MLDAHSPVRELAALVLGGPRVIKSSTASHYTPFGNSKPELDSPGMSARAPGHGVPRPYSCACTCLEQWTTLGRGAPLPLLLPLLFRELPTQVGWRLFLPPSGLGTTLHMAAGLL